MDTPCLPTYYLSERSLTLLYRRSSNLQKSIKLGSKHTIHLLILTVAKSTEEHKEKQDFAKKVHEVQC